MFLSPLLVLSVLISCQLHPSYELDIQCCCCYCHVTKVCLQLNPITKSHVTSATAQTLLPIVASSDTLFNFKQHNPAQTRLSNALKLHYKLLSRCMYCHLSSHCAHKDIHFCRGGFHGIPRAYYCTYRQGGDPWVQSSTSKPKS